MSDAQDPYLAGLRDGIKHGLDHADCLITARLFTLIALATPRNISTANLLKRLAKRVHADISTAKKNADVSKP